MCLYNYLAGTVLQVAMHLVTTLPKWIISPLVLHLPLSVLVPQVSRETALPHHKLLRHELGTLHLLFFFNCAIGFSFTLISIPPLLPNSTGAVLKNSVVEFHRLHT